MKVEMVQFLLWLSQEDHASLKRESERMGISMTALIRSFIQGLGSGDVANAEVEVSDRQI